MGFELSEDVVSLPLDGLTHFLPCADVSTCDWAINRSVKWIQIKTNP